MGVLHRQPSCVRFKGEYPWSGWNGKHLFCAFCPYHNCGTEGIRAACSPGGLLNFIKKRCALPSISSASFIHGEANEEPSLMFAILPYKWLMPNVL